MNSLLLESAEEVIKRIEGEITHLGDLILTNTKTKKQLIIKNPVEPIEPIISVEPIEPIISLEPIEPIISLEPIEPIISLEPIKPKKPIEFLDLPIEIRNIIKDFTFNERKYDWFKSETDNNDLKKIFNKQITNIDNMILLKKMFGKFPKELILNDNPYYYYYSDIHITSKWSNMKLPEEIENNFINILNKSKCHQLDIDLSVCLYNNLNFEIILEIYDKTTKNYFYIDKFGDMYIKSELDENNDDILYINDIIGSIKYKDIRDLITYIKTTLYNS